MTVMTEASARDRLQKVQSSVAMTKEELDRLAAVLAAAQLELQDINAKSTQDQLKLTDRKRELLLMLQQTGALKDALHTLLGEKKALPTEDVAPPVPIPNIDRRQYSGRPRRGGDRAGVWRAAARRPGHICA